MTLIGACVVPAGPLLVAGVSERPPEELHGVAEAAGAALRALAPHDVLVLLAGAPPEETAGVWRCAEADLGGLSRPDLRVALSADGDALTAFAAASGLTLREGPLPVDLAVLALQAVQARGEVAVTVVPIAVPWADGDELVALGRELVQALPGEIVIVASGDLSAGLTEKAPRHLVPGAGEWDEAARQALARGDVGVLAGLGPDEARRVVSRGWPGLVVLLAALEGGGLALRGVDYAAPRGVGYVIAAT